MNQPSNRSDLLSNLAKWLRRAAIANYMGEFELEEQALERAKQYQNKLHEIEQLAIDDSVKNKDPSSSFRLEKNLNQWLDSYKLHMNKGQRLSAKEDHMLFTDGFSLSPDQVIQLEQKLELVPNNTLSRRKLLGYYSAHLECCPDTRDSRLQHILWEVEHEPYLASSGYYMIFYPEDNKQYKEAKTAMLKRAKRNPYDFIFLEFIGDFLSVLEPAEACKYYEQALQLNSQDYLLRSSIKTARKDAESQAKGLYQIVNRLPCTCYWDVISSINELLESTKEKCKPKRIIWKEFAWLVNQMMRSEHFFDCLRCETNLEPDAPAIDLCRDALRLTYDFYRPNQEERKILRNPAVQVLWQQLIMI